MIGDDDINAFFDIDEHATRAVLIESARIITAIFDKPYSDAVDVQGFLPSLICKSSDVSDMTRGKLVEVGDSVYRVVLIEPDGTGITRMQLETYQ